MAAKSNQPPSSRKALKGQPSFGQVNRSALHLTRSKTTPISRTGQSTMGRVRAHGQHYKHV